MLHVLLVMLLKHQMNHINSTLCRPPPHNNSPICVSKWFWSLITKLHMAVCTLFGQIHKGQSRNTRWFWYIIYLCMNITIKLITCIFRNLFLFDFFYLQPFRGRGQLHFTHYMSRQWKTHKTKPETNMIALMATETWKMLTWHPWRLRH